MLVKMNCANGITGLDPQLPSENRVPIQRASGTLKQWTIDLSKHYILTIGFRYSDPTFRTNQYYITNGRVKDLTNNQGVTDCSVELSGTTLTVKGGSAASYYADLSLTEVGLIGQQSGGETGYKECGMWSAYQGHALSQVLNKDGTLQSGLNIVGEYLQLPYDNNYLYVKVAPTVEGQIEVDYYVTQTGYTPTLQTGTFSAGDTITSSAWSGGYVRSVFVGVRE